jgi:hypothetical protein
VGAMSRSYSAVFALGFVACALSACGGDGGSATMCTPTIAQPCACIDGRQGLQTCVASGDAYTACDCSGGTTAGAGSFAGQGAGTGGGAGVTALDGGVGPITLPDGAVVAADGGAPTGPGTVIAEPTDEAAFLWDDTQLRTFELTIASGDLATLNGSAAKEMYVPASFTANGETVNQVSVRYKGSFGAFYDCTNPITGAKLPQCPKLSMKVSFDEQLPDQRWHGLKKLNFHSMNDDDSLLRDRLGYAMFRETGLAAPRAVHARLLINGTFAGLFSLVEEIDGRFTDSRFTAAGDGNLYKEVWPKWTDASVYQPALRTNRGEPDTSVDRVVRFAQGLEAAADDAAVIALSNEWMDPVYLMNYIAVDRTILNDDGIFHWYCNLPSNIFVGYNPGACSNHNYFWYEEDRSDRLWLVAWDVTLALKGETSVTRIVDEWNVPTTACTPKTAGGGWQQIPPSCDKLVKAWGTQSDAYKAAIKRFLDGPFAAANVDAKLAAWQTQIMPVVTEAAAAGHTPSAATFASEVNKLKTAIADLRAAAQTRAQ